MRRAKRKTGRKRIRRLTVLLDEQGGKCWYCERLLPMEAATIDHLIPISKGGRNGYENIVAACQWCNEKRATKDAHEFREWVRKHCTVLGPVDANAVRRRKRYAKKRRALDAAFVNKQQQTRGWHEADTGFNQEVRLA